MRLGDSVTVVHPVAVEYRECSPQVQSELFVLSPDEIRSSPDLSSGLMAGAERRLAPFVPAILASGYDNSPADGAG